MKKTITGHEKLGELLIELHAAAPESCLLLSSALSHLLNRFLTGDIAAKDLAALADALEMNEAVVYEKPHEQIIADVLFVLSNPDINGPITPANVAALIQRLDSI